MRLHQISSLLTIALFLTPLASALAAFPDTIELPAEVDGDEAASIHLNKTGEAERKFLIFPIYKIAHYLQLPYESKLPIHQSESPRAVHLVFQRNISGERIKNDFLQLLRERTTTAEWRDIQASAQAYAAPFAKGKVKKGDIFQLFWTPEAGLISLFNGRPLSQIKDPPFTRILWSSWTGPNSVLDREALLGEVLDD